MLPLKNVVIFPRTILTLVVGRERSIRAVEQAQARDQRLIVAAQRQMDHDDPTPTDIHPVGTLVELMQVQRQPDGNIQIVVEGIRRVRVDRFTQSKPCFLAQATDLPDGPEPSGQSEALARHLREFFQKYAKLNRNIASEAVETVTRTENPGRLADLLAAHLPIDVPTKQSVLEIADQNERLDRMSVILANEVEILEMEQRIRSRVRQQMDRNQREYYLKEQLKAIHEELGSDAHSEAAELRARVAGKHLPEEVEIKLLREVQRLERMPQSSPEGNVIRTYLDLALSLPWNERSDDRLDIVLARRILDEDHYGLNKVKDRIIEFLAVRQLLIQTSESTAVKGPILCFVGPPGVGKTSLGKSIARSMNRKFVRLSLGGVRDEAEIRGHRRTYVGALPGRIIQGMRTAGTNNPVIMLDEIDKMSSDFRGDPAAALLEVLDPEQNSTFSDHYLDVPYDLSEVMFITTANVLWNIPRPLLDRMEVIDIPGYTEEEKLQIARRYLLPKQREQHGLGERHIAISDRALQDVVRNYTREAGVRNLERQVATICRKVATKVVQNPDTRVRVTPGNLQDLLGVSKFERADYREPSQIGVAMGLAWTETGGEILPIEVATMPGKGQLQITGRLGDVMQESARAALSYARSRADQLQIDRDFQNHFDLHIHVPEGATPKDGPSAGITMATALISALTKRPVRNDVAMTGEITLRGRVLPIGGLKEKVLAAHRVGIRTVLAPVQNERDLPEIPKKIREQVHFLWVDSMDQVLQHAFENLTISEPDPEVGESLPAADPVAAVSLIDAPLSSESVS
ncbi:MAG TPA: endopeptidase La [Dehalococcoidia bacterium]|nr:endopeptidase La [Dehalococcoidia bacterium]